VANHEALAQVLEQVSHLLQEQDSWEFWHLKCTQVKQDVPFKLELAVSFPNLSTRRG
jgi:hypothetical protein